MARRIKGRLVVAAVAVAAAQCACGSGEDSAESDAADGSGGFSGAPDPGVEPATSFALYSSDTEYHTGKEFVRSRDFEDWGDQTQRPTLEIAYADPEP